MVTLSGMPVPGGPSSGPAAEALLAVTRAQQWQLSEARWQAIDQLLDLMDAALAAGDADALAAAAVDLRLAGPLRITRVGATPVVPAPPPVRYRLNRLVHVLGGATAAPEDQDGTGDAPACDR